MSRRPHPMFSNACTYCGAPEGVPCNPTLHFLTDPEENPARIAYHVIGCDCAACTAHRGGPAAEMVPVGHFATHTPAPVAPAVPSRPLDLRGALDSLTSKLGD